MYRKFLNNKFSRLDKISNLKMFREFDYFNQKQIEAVYQIIKNNDEIEQNLKLSLSDLNEKNFDDFKNELEQIIFKHENNYEIIIKNSFEDIEKYLIDKISLEMSYLSSNILIPLIPIILNNSKMYLSINLSAFGFFISILYGMSELLNTINSDSISSK